MVSIHGYKIQYKGQYVLKLKSKPKHIVSTMKHLYAHFILYLLGLGFLTNMYRDTSSLSSLKQQWLSASASYPLRVKLLRHPLFLFQCHSFLCHCHPSTSVHPSIVFPMSRFKLNSQHCSPHLSIQ